MAVNKEYDEVQLDVEFTQASTRENLVSKENISISFGKISKYFADLHSQAFTGYTHPTYTARTGKPTGNQTPGFGATFTISQITSDGTGHVTGATDRTVKIPNTTMGAATADAAGSIGLVPAPAAGKQTSFLRGDGTWVVPTNTDTKVTDTVGTANTYYPAGLTGTTTTTGTQVFDTSFKFIGTTGTTSAVGKAQLVLGNATASGTANNKQGSIVVYGSTAYAHTIQGAPTAARTLTLPDKGGTFALTSDIPSVPTVNDAALTLKGAGTTVTTFTANSSSAKSLDIVAGSNVTITPDATNSKISIASSHPTITKSADTTSTASPAHGGTFTTVDSVTRDGNGHVTKINTKTVTLPADSNTDTKVSQTLATADNNRPLLMSYYLTGETTTTAQVVHRNDGLFFNPSSGGLYSFGFLWTDITGSTLDINTLTLSNGTPHSRRFIEKTDGGATNITNIPVAGKPFLLEVDLIRWASTTDYITRQRFTNAANGTYSYVRYCTNGTWGSWTTRKYTDTDTKVTSSANHYAPATVSGQDKSASATGATAAWSIDVVKGVTLNTDGKGHVTGISVTSGKIPGNPVPSNNVTGSGTSGYLTKWNGINTITNGPQLGSSTTTYLRNDGTWATPTNTTYSAGTGLSLSGTTFNHSNSVTAVTSAVFKKITYDAQGHITGTANVAAADIPSLNYVPNTQAGVNAAINLLSTGDSTPSLADYIVTQYVNGGTTTTSYHRRPISLLWNTFKELITLTTTGSGNAVTDVSIANDGDHNRKITVTKGSTFSLSTHTHSYLPLSGGTMTGDITFTGVGTSSYPSKSKGIYWSGGTDAIDMYYNLGASDAGELIINMRDDSNVRTSFAYNGTVKSYIDTNGTYNGNASKTGIRWNAVSQGQKWSRLYYSEAAVNIEGSNGILSISCTRGNVVVNAVFLVFVSHSGSNASHIIELASTNYSTIRCRVVSNSGGSYYFEIYDTANNIASGTSQTWHCCFVTLTDATLTTYTTFTDGSTIPSNFTATNDFTTTVGKASAAIKDISRSGTTFTATRQDGTTFTFTQQDNNTTYTIATGDSNGQIKVTPSSGSAYNVSVKGLGSAAYTASTSYVQTHVGANFNVAKSGYFAVMANENSDNPNSLLPTQNEWWHILSMSWNSYDSTNNSDVTNWVSQLAIPTYQNKSIGMKWRTNSAGGSALTRADWVTVLDEKNYTSYTVTKTGGGASGSWGISITGNASTSTKATQDGDGNTISSTYLKLSGGTMTGQLKTSFKESVAVGSYQPQATKIPDLCSELRFSSGVMGSVALSEAYTKDGITIAAVWYNFIWIPHRSGGVNGAASGDNCNYGSLILSGMTGSGAFIIRYASGYIAELKYLYKDTTYSANNGVGLSGTTFYNSGVRAVSTGSANGTISVNTNGTSGDVAVKGLGSAAYTASTSYVPINGKAPNGIGRDGYLAYAHDGFLNTGTGTVTGALVITTPFTKTKGEVMLKFTVDIYNYNSNTSVEYKISGYAYNDGKWYNCTAYCVSSGVYSTDNIDNLTVRFGYVTDGFYQVQIGETTTNKWQYPRINIHDITVAYTRSSYTDANSGWSVEFVTGGNISNITQTITNTAQRYLPLSGGTMTGTIQGEYPNTHIALAAGGIGDCANLDHKNDINISSWCGVSISNGCSNAGTLDQVTFSVNARSGLTQQRGNAVLYSASGDSPALIFQRGTFIDDLNDWKIYVSGGALYFAQSTANASSETWTNKMYFHASDGNLYVGSTRVSLNGHTHNYAGSSSAGGAATSANKLNTDAGTTSIPVYFSGGVPVQCTTPNAYQTNTTTNADYRVLFSTNANDTTQSGTTRKNINLQYNPSTATLKIGEYASGSTATKTGKLVFGNSLNVYTHTINTNTDKLSNVSLTLNSTDGIMGTDTLCYKGYEGANLASDTVPGSLADISSLPSTVSFSGYLARFSYFTVLLCVGTDVTARTTVQVSAVNGYQSYQLIWGGAPNHSGGNLSITSGLVNITESSGTITLNFGKCASYWQFSSSSSNPTKGTTPDIHVLKVYGHSIRSQGYH